MTAAPSLPFPLDLPLSAIPVLTGISAALVARVQRGHDGRWHDGITPAGLIELIEERLAAAREHLPNAEAGVTDPMIGELERTGAALVAAIESLRRRHEAAAWAIQRDGAPSVAEG